MAIPVTIPYSFANATTTQNLSYLDANYNALANGLNGLSNGTSQISISSISATGNANATTYLRGDGSWATVTGGGTDVTYSNVTVTQNLVPPSSFLRNRIINGAMQIWQRGTSGFTTNGNYAADRWLIGTSTSLSAVAQSTDVPSGYKYSLSIAGTNYPNALQRIESLNCTDLAGQNVTFSLWLKQSSGAGTNSIGITLYYANASDNFTSVTQIGSTSLITATASWAQYTVTFPAISSNAVNGIQIQIYANTASTSTFLITGAQLEVGSTATPFERRLYGQELALCQRYYEKSYNSAIAPGTSTTAGTGELFVNAINSGGTIITVNFAVPKRTNATVISYDNAGTSGKNSYYVASWSNGGTATVNTALERGFNITLSGTGAIVYFNSDWTASAEL